MQVITIQPSRSSQKEHKELLLVKQIKAGKECHPFLVITILKTWIIINHLTMVYLNRGYNNNNNNKIAGIRTQSNNDN